MLPLKYARLATAAVAVLGVSFAVSTHAQTPPPPPQGPEPFSAFDRNGDGVVTPEEFTAHREARQAQRAEAGRPMRQAGRGPEFSDFDRNGDSRITPDELSAGQRRDPMPGAGGGRGPGNGMGPGNGPRPGPGMGPGAGPGRGPGAGMGSGQGPGIPRGTAMRRNMPAFSDFDLNGDGRIDPQELQQARQARITERAQEGRQMRGLQDGMPAFGDMDSDGDGGISAEEFGRHQAAQPPRKGR